MLLDVVFDIVWRNAAQVAVIVSAKIVSIMAREVAAVSVSNKNSFRDVEAQSEVDVHGFVILSCLSSGHH